MPDAFVVAFTGSRGFDESRVVERIIKRLVHKYPSNPRDDENPRGRPGLIVRVGDARGADRLVTLECPRWGIWPDVQQCFWPARGTSQEKWAAAHERNGRVVSGADLLIALRAPGPHTPGTNDAIKQAKTIGVPIRIYHEGRWSNG